jgi:ferric-dicitrate binding protein FerR (iron transport regulator)
MEENYELARWLAGEMTESELIAFQKTPEYETYSKIATYSKLLEAPHFEEDVILNTVVHSKKTTTKVIPLYKSWVFKVAAILVVALSTTLVFQFFSSATETATNGERTSFLLPDTSEVVLNSGSEINYKKWNWDNNRKLELDGEAYFKVAKGKRFEVVTSLGKVTVLGTQFNVKNRNNRFDVTCFHGKVKVNYKTREIILKQGESVTFENNSELNYRTETSKPEWLENKIIFNKEKLLPILEEIERQYNVSIEIKAHHSNDLFTGKIPADNLDLSLEIIASTFHLKVQKTKTNKIIIEEK